MWIEEFKSLEHLRGFITDSLTYNEENGFMFLGLYPGLEMQDVLTLLGEPKFKNVTSVPQQVIYYEAQIDHPREGKLRFNKSTLEFVAYNRAPLKKVTLHTVYSDVGPDAETHRGFIAALINEIEGKFGKPDKKSLRTGKSSIIYQIGASELYIWQKFDGLRIQIWDKG